MKHAPTGALSRASLLACASLCATVPAHAANQTWNATPTDAQWATGTNWSGGAAPGTAAGGYNNASRNNDVATFNAAVGTIGGAGDPIQTDANRFLKGITFDTASAGSHVIGVSGGNQLQLDQFGVIQMNASVVNPQTVNADIRARFASSQNNSYTIRNDATLSTATLTIGGVLQVASSTGRGVNWFLDGSNTGDNLFNGTFSTAAGTGTGGFTALTKAGSGTWRVTGTNTLPSVAVTNGLLIADGAAALGTGPATVSGGTLSFGNFILGNSVVNLSGTGTVKATGTSSIARVSVSNAAPSTVTLQTDAASDVLTVGTGANSVTDGQAGSVLSVAGPGTVLLNATGTYTGTWSVDGGLLLANVPNSLGNAPSITFGNASTGILRLNGWDTTIAGLSSSATPGSATVENGTEFPITLTSTPAADVSFHGLIQDGGAGTLALTKGGAGSLTLASANTYTGGTNVTHGTLLATNSSGSATGTGAVGVTATGELGGTGTVSGAVTVDSGGKISPGTSVGTLTVGSLDLGTGSTLEYEFSGSSNDLVTVSSAGGLTVTSGAITLLEEGTANAFTTPGTYNLIAYSGTLNGSPTSLSVANPQPGFGYTFAANGTHVTVTIATTGAVRTWTNLAGGSWADSGNWNGSFPNAQGDSANFITDLAGGPATVTLDGNKTVGGITFASPSNSYTIAQGSGGTLTLDNGSNGSSILNGAGVHFLNVPIQLTTNTVVDAAAATDAITLGNPVAGGGTLTKTGPGSLGLLASNSFTGALTLSGGTTTFVDGGLGAGALSLASSKLVWASGNTQDISNRNITFDSGIIEFDTGDGDVSLANAIGNFGIADFIKSGDGKLTLAADAGFTGTVTLAAGTLQLGAGGTSGTLPGDIVNNGTLIFSRSDAYQTYGTITGTGSLIHAGSDLLELGGTNTFAGQTSIPNPAATIKLLNGLALQGSTLQYPASGGSIDFDFNGTATLGGLEGDKDLVLTNAAPGAVALTVGGNNSTTDYTGILSGDGSLNKVGTGTLTLGAVAHTYAGSTSVNGGTLVLPTGGSINTTSANVGVGAKLHITGGSLTSSVFSTYQNNGIAITLDSGSLAFNGGVQSSQNDGSLMEIWDGTFSALDVILRRSGIYNNDANGNPNPAMAGNNGFVVNGGTATITNTLQVGTGNSSGSALVTGGSLSVGGVVTLGNTTHGSRWSILEARGGTFTSTEAASGIVLSSNTVTGNLSMFLVSGGIATVERVAFGTATSAAGTGRVAVSAGELHVGSGGLVQDAPAFTPQVQLSGGVLAAKAPWSSSLPVTLSNIATIQAADASSAAQDITLSGAVTGTGSLVKTGAGTLTLGGTHAYAGNTEVDAGTLSLAAATLSDTGTLDIAATGAVLHLPHGQVDIVADFLIDGVSQGPGLFTSVSTGGKISGSGSIRVLESDPFIGWIGNFPVGGLTGKDDDADSDGLTNLEEFALDGDPSDGTASGKVRARIEAVGADQALVITLPVRNGASFSGLDAQSATVDGVTYTVGGSNDLTVFDQLVIETGVSADGMPTPLTEGWSYRTFRLDGAIGGATPRGPKGFLRATVAEAP